MISFSELKLVEPILASLVQAGYKTPTPIQEKAIPHLLKGRDLLGIAQTGTGKTAAFALPILDHLARKTNQVKPYSCQVLVLTPTRELAAQIQMSFQTYGKRLKLFSTVIFGGVSENAQIQAMSRGPNILIATPGRLLDLMEQRKVLLDRLEVFVLDEADRMLDMGFIHDVRRIISKIPAQRQTLLFSATMPNDIADLAGKILKDPVRVEVTPPSTTVEKIDQRVHFVDKKNKARLLRHILETEEYSKALVFTKTKRGANKVAEDLDKWDIRCGVIHGNKSQAARVRALDDFKSGRTNILIATDIAARGIDVPGISHVFNFDLPEEPETYVHRIGRTARAGKEGSAIAFCDISERDLLRDIEKKSRIEISVVNDHPYPALSTVNPEKASAHRKNQSRSYRGSRGSSFGGRSNPPRRRM